MKMKTEQEFHQGEHEYTMDQFRAEVAELAAREPVNANFFVPGTNERNPQFDASLLTEEDRDIWEKIKDGTIEMGEFEAYRDAVLALPEGDAVTETRVIFTKLTAQMVPRVLLHRNGFKQKGSALS